MKKSELRGLIRETIKEQMRGKQPKVHRDPINHMMQVLGNPQTVGAAHSAYTKWYHQNNMERVGDLKSPQELATLMRDEGIDSNSPDVRGWLILIGILAGGALAAMYGYSVASSIDDMGNP